VSQHPVGILDTNAVILAERLDPDQLPVEAVITAVTLAELSLGPLATDDPTERAVRQLRLQDAEASFDPLPFDTAAARAFGQVASALRRSGRKPAARAMDALIAATALAHDLPLFTCNPADFDRIPGLVLMPVDHPDG
jgi:tRNA(fMet)-specific endonuclease VapC